MLPESIWRSVPSVSITTPVVLKNAASPPTDLYDGLAFCYSGRKGPKRYVRIYHPCPMRKLLWPLEAAFARTAFGQTTEHINEADIRDM